MLVDAGLSQKSKVATDRLGFFKENQSSSIETRESIYMILFSLGFKKRVNPTAGVFQKSTSVSHLLSL